MHSYTVRSFNLYSDDDRSSIYSGQAHSIQHIDLSGSSRGADMSTIIAGTDLAEEALENVGTEENTRRRGVLITLLAKSPIWAQGLLLAFLAGTIFSLVFFAGASLMSKSFSLQPDSLTENEYINSKIFTTAPISSIAPSLTHSHRPIVKYEIHSERVSNAPTISSTVLDTLSYSPSMRIDKMPTALPSVLSHHPSLEIIDTKNPSFSPSLRLSLFPSKGSSEPSSLPPSSSAPISTAVTFTITGGHFDDESTFITELRNSPQDSTFLVHLGNFNRNIGTKKCQNKSFLNFNQLLKVSKIPVFLTLGDKDVSNCENGEKATNFWQTYFGEIHNNWDHQFTYTERLESIFMFSIYQNDLLFVGLNIYKAKNLNEDMYFDLLDQNIEWVRTLLKEESRTVKALILFGNERYPSVNRFFFEKIKSDIQELGLPVVYFFQGNGPKVEMRDGIAFVDVKEGTVPFMKVTVETGQRTMVKLH